MFTLRLTNLESVQRGHQHFLAANSRLFSESLAKSGAHAKDHVNRYPLFKRQSGNLQSKTKTRVVRTAGGRLLRLDNTADYADAIDGGSKKHLIAAKNKRALAFRWKGVLIFKRYVIHPGTRPYKFMFRAWGSAGRVERQELERGMREIATRF